MSARDHARGHALTTAHHDEGRPRTEGWPRSPRDFVDTTLCPSCFTTISASAAATGSCATCGLTLTDARLTDVLRLGTATFEREQERQALLHRIREDAAASTAAAQRDAARAAERASARERRADDRHRSAPSAARAAAAPPAAPAPVPTAGPPAAAAPTLPVAPTPTAAPAPAAAAPAPAAAAPTPTAPAPAAPPAAPPAPAAAAPPAPTAPAPAARPAPRPRVTVPALLLIVGVSLVGIAAVFFLTVAWFVTTLPVRALIVAGITVATIAAASALRRRGLTATAEAIAVIGVVLLGLDVWAVHANDLFGAGSIRPSLYAGVALIGLTVLLRLWSRASSLRSPDLASVLTLPAGIAVATGAVVDLRGGAAASIACAAAALGTLVHALPAPWSAARSDATTERTILAAVGAGSLAAAFLWSPWAGPDSPAYAVAITVLVVVIGAAHARLLVRPLGAEPVAWAGPLSTAQATLAAVAATVSGWQLALREPGPLTLLLIAPVVAAVVPAVLERWGRRVGVPPIALFTAAAIGAASAGGAAIAAVAGAVPALRANWMPWLTAPLTAPPIDGAYLPLIAALLIAVAAASSPSLARGRRPLARNGAITLLLVAGAVHTGIPGVIALVCTAIAAAGVVIAVRARRLPLAGAVPALIAAASGYALTPASAGAWAVSSTTLIGALVGLAAAARFSPAGRTALALAAVATGAATALIAPAAISALVGSSAGAGAAAGALLQAVALATLVAAVLRRRAAAPASDVMHRALRTAGLAIAGVSLLPVIELALPPVSLLVQPGPVSAAIGEPVVGIVRAALLLLVVLAVALAPGEGDAARRAAGILLAPIGGAVVIALARTVELGAATPVLALTAFALVSAAGAAHALSASEGAVRPARTAADASAIASATVVLWTVPAELRALAIALIALTLAAISVTRGWAAPRTAALPGLPTAAAPGVPTGAAVRRLAAWPAFAAAVAAWWTGVTDAAGPGLWPPLEAYTVAPAIGLAGFAAALAWLRRHVEAAVAVSLAIAVGLGVAALPTGAEAARAVTATLVAAAIAVAVAWTPARKWGPAGAAAAVTAPAVATIDSVGMPGADETSTTVATTMTATWLILPPATALVAGLGFTRAAPAPSSAQQLYPAAMPPITIAVSALLAFGLTSGQGRAVTGALAFTALLLLHLAAAAIGRAPLGGATRWTALAGAALLGLALSERAGVVEAVSLPFAAALLAGAATAMLRSARAGRPWHAVDAGAWIAGLTAAIGASLLAPEDIVRTWLVVTACLLSALALLLAEVPRTVGLTTASIGMLTAGALAMGMRSALGDPVGIAAGGSGAGGGALVAAIVAGLGAVAVGAVAVTQPRLSAPLPVALAGSGLASTLVLVGVRSDGSIALTAALVAGGAVAATGAAALRGSALWHRLAGVVAVGALAIALTAVAVRVSLLLARAPGFEADLWVCAGVAAIVAAALVAARSDRGPAPWAALATAAAVLGLAEAVFISVWSPGAAVRTAAAVTVLTVAAVAGWLTRPRGGVLAAAAASAVAVVALAAVVAGAADPVELVTLAPAAGLSAIGAARLRRDPRARSWPSLGAGLGLATVPSLVYDLGENDLWRIVGLGLLSVALVIVGARRRLQAPLVVGVTVLLAHGVAQLWPWLSDLYVATPWWLWVGIGGVLLIVVAARYERQRQSLRKAYDAVTSLR